MKRKNKAQRPKRKAKKFFERDHGAVVFAAPLGGRGAPHRPVLLDETVKFLAPERGGLFIDCTVGLGGHSEAILNSSGETRVLGIDLDSAALEYARDRLASFGERFRSFQANFREIREVLQEANERDAAGVLVDLGVSSLQFDSPERGFSFRFDAPLDMRMDPTEGDTAADLLQQLPESEIARIIFEYGEERHSRRIARRIVERREQGKPITTTTELADLVRLVVGGHKQNQIHPATRTFQALRIAVNHELEGLGEFVESAIDLLTPEGRFVGISFHSLEDRILKRELRRLSGHCECPPRLPVCECGAREVVEVLTRRPVVAGIRELEENPRARSAKLRACRKKSQ
ncbi:MAG TPA: 16S rRNA (cytosine(1402)-N(4))-methyltransferase RsmH [Pyrinomonadaceae bacterium]|nr:16S rRNA (cytosine(1402)-N(4))-methyltransferase RsmH [Pyrinomonadaceae bacterium]